MRRREKRRREKRRRESWQNNLRKHDTLKTHDTFYAIRNTKSTMI